MSKIKFSNEEYILSNQIDLVVSKSSDFKRRPANLCRRSDKINKLPLCKFNEFNEITDFDKYYHVVLKL